ncbi:MAG: glycosyltransferase family 2 protein [Acutalibacteraceae bacterium]|nr:glycosyltransferase family 2 protein [Acutalibacteraceae bacterium]
MLVTLCVIAYNEERFLQGLFEDIRNQSYAHNKIELVLVNNGSTDKTRNIMERFAEKNDFFDVKIVDNYKSNQATGWNTALLNTTGNIIIKVDAHAKIPTDFVQSNVDVISSGEYVCGGGRPNIPVKDKPWDNTLLAAEECMFGGSFAKYRNLQSEKKYINSIFNGAYRREVFARVGGFNEALGRTEDNEFHYRLTKAGYKICCSPDIISYQYIRSDLPQMIKQKYGNGYWIGLTVKEYPKCLSLFHFVPLFFVLGIVVCLLMAVVGHPLFLVLLLGAYLLFDGYITFNAMKSEKRCKEFALLPLIFPALHIAYGIGTLIGIFHLPIRKDNLIRAKKRIRQVKRYYMEN